MDHRVWMAMAAEEYRRLLELLRDLDEGDWQRATDCSAWDVRGVVAHLVGAAECTASLVEARRQQKLGGRLRPGLPVVDGMNAVQVAERATVSPVQLRADLLAAGRRGVRARSRLPAAVRAVPVPFGPPLGLRSVGYLMDRIYTRDAWMHRVDIARATGRAPVMTKAHDALLVADVVAEWSRAHGLPFDLTLDGPAGGHWSRGAAPERMHLDAVEFCRTLSGRADGDGLLAQPVPF